MLVACIDIDSQLGFRDGIARKRKLRQASLARDLRAGRRAASTAGRDQPTLHATLHERERAQVRIPGKVHRRGANTAVDVHMRLAIGDAHAAQLERAVTVCHLAAPG